MGITDIYSGSLSDCISPLILGVSVDKNGHITASTCPVLQDFARSVGVKGKAGEVWRTPTSHDFQAPPVIFAGLGDLYADCGATEVLHEAAGAATRLVEAKEVALSLLARSREEITAIAEGTLLSGYRFDKYLTKKSRRLERISLPSETPVLDVYTRNRVEVIAKAVADTCGLIDTSPPVLYSKTLAKWMESTAKNPPVKVKIWNYTALKAEGFSEIAAVGRGSKHKSVLVKMTYEPAEYRAHITLADKGITSDSGGYVSKPPSFMVTTETNMTGAATMGNTVLAAARLQLPVKVMAWLTCAENIASGGMTRNDSIIIIKDGTSVEVNNIGTEGRLVMTDGITMALAQKPDLLVDTAILIGVQVVALGSRTAGVMGSAKDEYFAATKRVGELAWPYPLLEHLAKDLKSEVVDMRSLETKHEGGMLLAGLFLRHFTKDAYWVYVDIAGPDFSGGSAWGCTPKGGTGYGLHILVDLLENFRKPSA